MLFNSVGSARIPHMGQVGTGPRAHLGIYTHFLYCPSHNPPPALLKLLEGLFARHRLNRLNNSGDMPRIQLDPAAHGDG